MRMINSEEQSVEFVSGALETISHQLLSFLSMQMSDMDFSQHPVMEMGRKTISCAFTKLGNFKTRMSPSVHLL